MTARSLPLLLAATVTALAAGAPRAAAQPGAHHETGLTLQGVTVRDGVTADIHVRVHSKGAPCQAGTVLAVPGATATANSLGALARALLDESPTKQPVCRVVVMNLPGHGDSSLPTGARFGDLALADYARSVIGTLDRLRAAGIRPTAIMGHSMGGLVVQLVQEQLVQEGSSLRDRFNVRHAILLGAVPPGAVPWAIQESGILDAALAPFIVEDEVLGGVVYMPPLAWVYMSFTTLLGSLAEGAPTAEEVEDEGYMGPESLTAMNELNALEGKQRPDVAPGIFGDAFGTRLDVVTFEHDTLITPADSAPHFTYLTGKPTSEPGFVLIEGQAAVHGMPLNAPFAIIEALRTDGVWQH